MVIDAQMPMRDRAKGVREPVQVYLTPADRRLLREVAAASNMSGAEVLRRGLRRMAGEILGARSPAMRLLEEMNAAAWPADMPDDVGRSHDAGIAAASLPAEAPQGSRSRKRRVR
jgi:hypothetical protein